MQSNQMKAENQRIERISPSTLVVGIDIAKETHVVQATNFRGISLTKRGVMVDNDRDGFEHLERTIRQLKQNHGLDDVIVGMESTGHYWFNIANWLMEKGIDVVLVNPLTTKRNKENRTTLRPRVIQRMHWSSQTLSVEVTTPRLSQVMKSFSALEPSSRIESSG